jgi:hypothetical protein
MTMTIDRAAVSARWEAAITTPEFANIAVRDMRHLFTILEWQAERIAFLTNQMQAFLNREPAEAEHQAWVTVQLPSALFWHTRRMLSEPQDGHGFDLYASAMARIAELEEQHD